MTVKTQLFINSINMVEIDGRTNIPTVLYYEKGRYHIGYDAHDSAESANLINENFKLELGKQDPAVINRRQFATGSGETPQLQALGAASESQGQGLTPRGAPRTQRQDVAGQPRQDALRLPSLSSLSG